MFKRVTLVIALLGMVCSVETSQAPRKKSRRWTTGTLRRKKNKDPKQVLLEEMNQAWAQVMSIFNQQVQQVSSALRDVKPGEVKAKLNEPAMMRYISDAKTLFQTAVADYFEDYNPEKLLDVHSAESGSKVVLKPTGAVIRQAELYKAKAERKVVHFEKEFVEAVQQLKYPQPSQSPPRTRPSHSPSVSLETRLTKEWNKILQEMDKSAAELAQTLDVTLPETDQDDNNLLVLLASISELVQEEFYKIAAMIDRFEKKWNDLFSKFSDDDKKDALDIFDGFVRDKPKSINDFKVKIIEYWRSAS